MTTYTRFATIAFLTLTFSTPAAGQKRQMDADLEEIASYRLTMDTLDKATRATRSMAEEMKKDPKMRQMMELQTEISKLEKKSSESDDGLTEVEQTRLDDLHQKKERLEDSVKSPMNDAKTLDDMEAGIRGMPLLRSALRREGLAPREYAKFVMALMQAGMVYSFQKAGHAPPREMAGVNPENVRFVAEHEKDLEAMRKEFQALGSPEN